jgi:outer membrane immunogenic protein
MVMKYCAAYLLTIIVCSGAAQAQEARPARYNGYAGQAPELRLELHGGYDRLADPEYFSPSDSSFRPAEGAFFGAAAGYDRPVGDRVFAGIEAGVDFSTGLSCEVNPLILAPGIFENCIEPGRDLSAIARIGVRIGDGKAKIYALSGYSNLRLEESSRLNGRNDTGVLSSNLDGIRFGAGLEYALTERFYGKVEYRYSNYNQGFSRNQLLVGAGIRF